MPGVQEEKVLRVSNVLYFFKAWPGLEGKYLQYYVLLSGDVSSVPDT